MPLPSSALAGRAGGDDPVLLASPGADRACKWTIQNARKTASPGSWGSGQFD
jgi:hypothetical protein